MCQTMNKGGRGTVSRKVPSNPVKAAGYEINGQDATIPFREDGRLPGT
jgi:hypothetical protein